MSTIYLITPEVGRPVKGRVQGNGGLLTGEHGLHRLEFFA
jgi:hypothetical protein